MAVLSAAQGVRILGAQIDVALRRPHRDARDGHALDERERVALHQHAVGEGARVAFVGIAGDVFLPGLLIEHRLPLDAGREGGAAAAAQPRIRHGLHDLGARQRESARRPW